MRFAHLSGLVVGCALACNSDAPRVLESTEPARAPVSREGAGMSESGKIRALIEDVRKSEHTFIQDATRRAGPTAAADLERRLARVPAGIATARQFIDRVGAGKLRAEEQDMVQLGDGTVVMLRDWLLQRLADLEGRPLPRQKLAAADAEAVAAGSTPTPAGEVGILDALRIVEQSNLIFVAPPRKTPKGKLKGKRKEYTGMDFSDMLRKKWELLGKDIHDLDTFIDEIASDAFVSMTPYVVMHPDGREEEFRNWLSTKLDAHRSALAKGGAP